MAAERACVPSSAGSNVQRAAAAARTNSAHIEVNRHVCLQSMRVVAGGTGSWVIPAMFMSIHLRAWDPGVG